MQPPETVFHRRQRCRIFARQEGTHLIVAEGRIIIEIEQVRRDRLEMASQLSALPGLTVYPSQGNFLFVRLPVGAEGTVVRDRMLTEHRILVRECGNKIGSSSRFLRLVVRPQVDVRRLVSGLESVLYGSRRGAAVSELGTGTSYSSGTAAVDRLVSEKLKRLNILPAPLCSDNDFLRRVYLDVIGQLPPPEEVRRFVSDPDPDTVREVAVRLRQLAAFLLAGRDPEVFRSG